MNTPAPIDHLVPLVRKSMLFRQLGLCLLAGSILAAAIIHACATRYGEERIEGIYRVMVIDHWTGQTEHR